MAEGIIQHEILSREKLALDSTKATGDVYIERIGNLRIIYGIVNMLVTGGFNSLVTLSNDKPKVDVYASCSAYNVSAASDIKLTAATGALQVSTPANGNTNTIKFNFSYSVA